MLRTLFTILMLVTANAAAADGAVYKITVDQAADEVYDKVHAGLEDARFYVVFEPNIGRNLEGFAERWGEDYNRNGLTSLRAMVFCNAWYANQVSNRDPDMLGLCPMHLTVFGRAGRTTVVFNRPTVIAAGSDALPILQQLEQELIAAIEASLGR